MRHPPRHLWHPILCAAAAGLLAAATATAQARQKRVLRHDAAAYVPTAEGTTWTYLRTTDNTLGQPGRSYVGRAVFGTYRREDGSRWHLVAIDSGHSKPGFEHWNTEGPGLLVQATAQALAEFRREGTACQLAAPVGAVNRWYWSEGTEKEPRELRASVVAAEELVTVPAGAWRAVRVRVEEFDGEGAARSTTDRWFARDVGMVRQETTKADSREVLELTRFAAGRDQSADRLATLQVLAPPDWLWSARGAAKVTWLDQDVGSVAFGGRFAIVDDGQQRRCAFVRVGSFVEVPATYGDWRPILGTEVRASTLLAQTTARIHAARLGLWATRLEVDGGGLVTLLFGTDARGQRRFEVTAGGKLNPWVDVRETTPGVPAAEK